MKPYGKKNCLHFSWSWSPGSSEGHRMGIRLWQVNAVASKEDMDIEQ